MPNETYRALPGYKISHFFSSLLDHSLRTSRIWEAARVETVWARVAAERCNVRARKMIGLILHLRVRTNGCSANWWSSPENPQYSRLTLPPQSHDLPRI